MLTATRGSAVPEAPITGSTERPADGTAVRRQIDGSWSPLFNDGQGTQRDRVRPVRAAPGAKPSYPVVARVSREPHRWSQGGANVGGIARRAVDIANL